MRSALGIGTVLVTGLATAALAFLVAPDRDDDDAEATPTTSSAPGAGAAAREFWDLALAGDCRAASDLMWWPADRAARQRGYREVCRAAQLPDGVSLGEPRRVGSSQVPYGATDYVVVAVTLTTDGQAPVEDELQMVEVDDEWYVTR